MHLNLSHSVEGILGDRLKSVQLVAKIYRVPSKQCCKMLGVDLRAGCSMLSLVLNYPEIVAGLGPQRSGAGVPATPSSEASNFGRGTLKFGFSFCRCWGIDALQLLGI